jgi:hypothetical protein
MAPCWRGWLKHAWHWGRWLGLKPGDQGLYLRTTAEQGQLEAAGRVFHGNQRDWRGRELLAPCFQARIMGTTGAGEPAFAGLRTSALFGSGPEAALRNACAVGVYSAEAADAASSMPRRYVVQRRLASGWQQCPVALALPGWRLSDASSIWHGPRDRHAAD